MAAAIQSPEKELRFTRSGQAVLFWLAAAVLGTAAITLLATSIYRETNPELPHPAWALAPLAGAVISARLAWRLTRHAYLILTPIGIEIFPFFRPEAGMALVSWQEVDAVEVNARRTRLTLHHDAARTSGIHLSLRPLRADRRDLLIKVMAGRGKLDSGLASSGGRQDFNA
jgi:hypothetical protein